MSHENNPGARRARPGNTRLLAATYRPVPGFRLTDGRFTSLRALAEDDVSAYRGPDVAAALLSLPVEPARDRPTPARTAALRQLMLDGHVPASVGQHFLNHGGISDAAWEVLRPLLYVIEGPPVESGPCWEITLVNVSGHRFELPARYDAGEHEHPSRPPISALQEILAALAARGWHLGWGQGPPWDAGLPEHPDEARSLASPIVVELFHRRTRSANRPRGES